MKIERVRAIYAELEKYEITLDPDPVSRGPRYLQGLIATGRNHLNAVSRLLLEVHQEKQALARDSRAYEAAFQVSFDQLLANDERIRRLPNIEDRKSTAKVFLREDLHQIERTKSELQDLEFVEKAIRHRHRELSSTMNEIKLQKSLIQAEIHTGAMYGDERGVAVPSGGPLGEEINEEELEALFDQPYQPETPTPPPQEALQPAPKVEVQPEPKPEPEPPPPPAGKKPTEDDVAAFLGAVDGTGASTDNFDDIFENL